MDFGCFFSVQYLHTKFYLKICIALRKSVNCSKIGELFVTRTLYFNFNPMKRILSWLLVFILSSTSLTVLAQKIDKKILREANYSYDQSDFKTAAENYEKLIHAAATNAEIQFKLGRCYLEMGYEKRAVSHIEKAGKIDPEISPDYLYILARALQISHRFDEAIVKYKDFIKVLSNSEDIANAEARIRQCEYGKDMVANPVKAKIDNVGGVINGKYSEYAPVISADESVMMFTSTREGSVGGVLAPNGEYFEDIYESRHINGQWTTPKNMGEPINTGTHDACIALAPRGDELFIYKDKKEDIYYSKKRGDGWSKPKSMGDNINTKYSELSISVTEDEKTVYFSSNRPGGYGGFDIYMSKMDKNGDWGPAINLGPMINTGTDEDSPFISVDGEALYFSSRGHETMGGYDIFISFLEDGKWTDPVNIGYPINTSQDDIYFVLSADGKHGYYASGKEGGRGGKDIYMITMPKGIDDDGLTAKSTETVATNVEMKVEKQKTDNLAAGKTKSAVTILQGKVIDEISQEPLEATVTLVDNATGEVISEEKSNATTGSYLVTLPSGKNYGIAISRDDYLFHSENFDLPKSDDYQEINKDIALKKIAVGSRIVLKNIFFDTGKSTLRPESNTEIDRLYDLLKEVPTMKIEISGHTDNIGSQDYNQKLSESRASAVTEYLLQKGIVGGRLTYKGYGFSRPIAPNDNDENRQLNRRTEFEIKEN